MKNTDEILSSAGETLEYARQYFKQQGDYIRLEAAERISRTTSAMVTALVLGIFSMLVLIMLSLAAAFWLGSELGSYSQAFVIVAAAYCLLGLIMFAFRKRFVTIPTLKLVLNAFFDKENEERQRMEN
jgi:Putative Actinobacterial Holin-X, holin superfamily III